MRYDTLIIGAGLSGLAAGIRLAYFDQKVCILERHTTIGGLNSFYRLRGRNYDVGLHAVTNFATPGTKTGALSKLLRQLRFRWEDFNLSPQIESRVVFPGASLRFSNDTSLLVDQVAEVFPSQADRFVNVVRLIDETEVNEHRSTKPSLSAREFLREQLSDPLLIEMLLCPLMFYGSPSPHDMDFLSFAILFKSIYREGFGRPVDGVRSIMKHVVRKYKELGGELRLRAGVQQILRDGNRVTGVVLDDGSTVEAERIFSSAGYYETMRMCGAPPQPQADGPATDGIATGRPGEITFVESIATLDCQPADLDYHTTVLFYNNTPEFRFENPAEPCDLRSGIICSPNNFQYGQPLDEGCIRVTALANKDYWMSLPEEEYVSAKQRWNDQVLTGAEQFVPGFQSHAIEQDMFTPRTIRKFTGHVNGAVYGSPDKHWTGTTPLDNLFICGTDQGYLGIVGSMLSGITVANLHALRPA